MILSRPFGLSFIFVLVTLINLAKSSNWYYDNWCGGQLQYLDDKYCSKIFPPNYNRDWTCPSTLLESPPPTYQIDTALDNVEVDTKTLTSIIDDSSINLCVVLIKRVTNESNTNGFSLFNRYLCNGNDSVKQPFETWSSSKIFAMANAAGKLRTQEPNCGNGDQMNRIFGLDSAVEGKHGLTGLGDLSTIICSYDKTAGYSSNSLSSYFYDLGWRERLNGLTKDWLGGKAVENGQSLGGNYGEDTPADLNFSVVSTENNTTNECAADKDPWVKIFENSLPPLAAAEMTRRIVMHREVGEILRFPGMTWVDAKEILYGLDPSSGESNLFPGLVWGGMSTDTAIFLQSALFNSGVFTSDFTQNYDWRIFSKLGAGYSSSRSRGEIWSNGYVCIPPTSTNSGMEFTLSVRGSVVEDYSLLEVEQKVNSAVEKVIAYLAQHDL